MHQYRPLLTTDLEDPSELELDVFANSRDRDEGHQLIERGLSILAHQSRKISSLLLTVKTRHMLALLPQFLQPDGLRLTKTLHPTSYLDALRGYAAWVVLNFHLRNPETWLLQQFPLRVFHRGRAMVDIFFIISGYVLSLKTLRLMRQQNDSALLTCLASSTFRRYLRLYLSCIAATLISMVLVHLGVIGFWFNQRQDTVLAELSHWAANTLLVFANPFAHITGWWDYGCLSSNYLDVLWTIPVEFRGSIVVFVFCTACCKLPVRTRIITCWTVILLCYCWQAVYVALFMFGVFLAERQNQALSACRTLTQSESHSTLPRVQLLDSNDNEKPPTQQSQPTASRILYTSILILGLFLVCQPDDLGGSDDSPFPWRQIHRLIPSWWGDNNNGREQFWLGIGACVIVYSLDAFPPFQVPFKWGFSQYLGRISFGIYIVHTMIQSGIYERYLAPFRTAYLGDALWCWTLVYPLHILATLWAADYFTRVDQLVISFGRWLENKTFV